jgi:hypothetical protein
MVGHKGCGRTFVTLTLGGGTQPLCGRNSKTSIQGQGNPFVGMQGDSLEMTTAIILAWQKSGNDCPERADSHSPGLAHKAPPALCAA